MDRHVTRRSVVKLAYAMPVIAATVRMDQQVASASVACFPPCGRCERCSDGAGGCVPIPDCVP